MWRSAGSARRISPPLPGFTFSTDSRGCLTISTSTMSFGSLTTNDVVNLHSSTSFSWVGRFDNVINSGGIKIFPEEIEKLIAPLLPDGMKAYITSRRSDLWGEEAILVCDSGSYPPDILEKIRESVGPKKAPKAVIVDGDMRLTDSKKSYAVNFRPF